jgi:signal transduction histidine kinase
LLARLDSGDVDHKIGPVDLTEVVDEAVEVFRPIMDERRVTVRMEMDQRVTADASSEGVARVVRNLLDNAVRHSPDGGEIVVSISNGDWAKVRIADTGQGFSDEFVGQAFDRFSRDGDDRNRVDGGAGLGLAIARRYVDDFGGRIWADPGPGGSVSFVLPNSVTFTRS